MSQSSAFSSLAWPITALSLISAAIGFYLYSDALDVADAAKQQAQTARQVEKRSLTQQSELQRQLNTAIFEFEQRQNEFSQLRASLAELQQKSAIQQQEWLQKQQVWQDKIASLNDQQAELTQAEAQVLAMSNQLAELTQQLDEAHIRLEQVVPDQQMAVLKQQFDSLMAENEALKASVDTETADKAQLLMALADAKSEISRLDQQMAAADARINELSLSLELDTPEGSAPKLEVKVDSPAVVLPSEGAINNQADLGHPVTQAPSEATISPAIGEQAVEPLLPNTEAQAPAEMAEPVTPATN